VDYRERDRHVRGYPLEANSWTVNIIPHCGASPRVYRVSRRQLGICGALAALLMAALALLSYGFLQRHSSERELREVLGENRALMARLDEMEKETAKFRERMAKVTAVETQFREIAGLAGIEPEVMKAGIGGPSIDVGARYDGAWLSRSTGERVEQTREDLYTLFRRADLVYQGLVESLDQMQFSTVKFSRTPSVWPTKGTISSGFGIRPHPIFGDKRPHEGIDIYAPKGSPIIATADGKVVRAGWEAGYGLSLLIDHGYGYKTLYAHCSKLKKNKGDTVSRGDIIAMVGSTGITTGPHLHYEVIVNGKNVNPVYYILGTAIPD